MRFCKKRRLAEKRDLWLKKPIVDFSWDKLVFNVFQRLQWHLEINILCNGRMRTTEISAFYVIYL